MPFGRREKRKADEEQHVERKSTRVAHDTVDMETEEEGESAGGACESNMTCSAKRGPDDSFPDLYSPESPKKRRRSLGKGKGKGRKSKAGHRKRKQEPTVPPSPEDVCCICGEGGCGARNEEISSLSDDTRKSVTRFLVEWKDIPHAEHLTGAFVKVRQHALNLLAATQQHGPTGQGNAPPTDDATEPTERSSAVEANPTPPSSPPLWKHFSCLDYVRNRTTLNGATEQASRNHRTAMKRAEVEGQEGGSSEQEDMSEGSGHEAQDTTSGPTTRSQMPSAQAQPGRTGVCAVCGNRWTRKDGSNVYRVCEAGSIDKLIEATRFHKSDEESGFHQRSHLMNEQFMHLDSSAAGVPAEAVRSTVLGGDMEVHNNCRLQFCRSARVYVGRERCGESARDRRQRVHVGICEFIRDDLVCEDVEKKLQRRQYGVKVSDTYPLYEDVMGNIPGNVEDFRRTIVDTYNKRIAPHTKSESRLALIVDETSPTTGYYFCLEESQHNALLSLCQQDQALRNAELTIDALSKSQLSALTPTVRQNFDVVITYLRAAMHQVTYETGVTTAVGLTEEEALRCGGGRVAADFMYSCICSEDERASGKQEDGDVRRRATSITQDMQYALTGKCMAGACSSVVLQYLPLLCQILFCRSECNEASLLHACSATRTCTFCCRCTCTYTPLLIHHFSLLCR
ncbi:MAG: hypothetical protein CME32_09255 [Gimesia sp.]|nr:hypothetical protein [Gimesia sp.]